ncbi:hypothetical protein ACIPSA_16465 [Streptomyces sp. NPDC086549]|uniref:hypothetical protein n=1 Tax=Streptomyces sp. NPDC086549 TaxID=3365752 RepID=UPI0038058B85
MDSLDVCCLLIAGLLVHEWMLRRRRRLVAGVGFALFMTWLGQQGSLSYLGVRDPSPESWYGAVAAAAAASLVNLVVPERRTSRREAFPERLRGPHLRAAVAVGLAGSALMVLRYAQYGAPLLAHSRSETVGSVSPLLSLTAAACLAASVAMSGIPSGRLPAATRLLIATELVLVALSGSRLLLLAMVLMFATARMRSGAWRLSPKGATWAGLAAAVIAFVVLPGVYSLRATHADGTAVLAQRTLSDPRLSENLIRIIGPGTYISARNGAAVTTRLVAMRARPRHGYVGAAELHLASIAPGTPYVEDPEIFLTESVFGLDRSVVGSTALPVTSAVYLDFGLWACALFGGLGVVVYDRLGRLNFFVANWFVFGLAMSAYGMYLFSPQFVALLAAFGLLTPWLRRIGAAGDGR